MVVVVLFLVLLRIVNSPFGRVLQAIRENDFRAEALGFRTVTYRTVSTVLAAVLTPDRWLLWLGVLFVLSVYYFPTGVVGRLRAREKTVKTDQARG